MYAIRDKKTKEWLYGTEKRTSKQLVSIDRAKTFESRDEAYDSMFTRSLDDKRFEVLEVSLMPRIKIDESMIDEMVKMARALNPKLNYEEYLDMVAKMIKNLKL